eukprot:358676-Chlamydomonas_euryale.AAC.2
MPPPDAPSALLPRPFAPPPQAPSDAGKGCADDDSNDSDSDDASEHAYDVNVVPPLDEWIDLRNGIKFMVWGRTGGVKCGIQRLGSTGAVAEVVCM